MLRELVLFGAALAIAPVSLSCKGETTNQTPGAEEYQPPAGPEHGTGGTAPWPDANPGGSIGGGPSPVGDERVPGPFGGPGIGGPEAGVDLSPRRPERGDAGAQGSGQGSE